MIKLISLGYLRPENNFELRDQIIKHVCLKFKSCHSGYQDQALKISARFTQKFIPRRVSNASEFYLRGIANHGNS